MDENNETQSRTAETAGLGTASAPSSDELEGRDTESDTDTVAAEETDALDEDSEDEDEDEDDDEDSEDEEDDDEDEEPVDYWEDDNVIAFGDDMECKFDASLIPEIQHYAGDNMLVFPFWKTNLSPRSTKRKRLRLINWISVRHWHDASTALDDLQADYVVKDRLDRDRWDELVAVWYWGSSFGDPFTEEECHGLDPIEAKIVEQFNVLDMVEVPGNSRVERFIAGLENLRKQALVASRETLRTELDEAIFEFEVLEAHADPETDSPEEVAGRTGKLASLEAQIKTLKAQFEEISTYCRNAGTID